MRKIAEVEEAKELMTVAARDWSVWKWLMEKKSVRAAADRAVEALEKAEKEVKSGWSEDHWKAYRELEAEAEVNGNPKAKKQFEKAREAAKGVPEEIKTSIRKVKEMDDVASEARWTAEDIFEEAEKRMSTGMAREGAQKAIDSWILREKAIRKAESLRRQK